MTEREQDKGLKFDLVKPFRKTRAMKKNAATWLSILDTNIKIVFL